MSLLPHPSTHPIPASHRAGTNYKLSLKGGSKTYEAVVWGEWALGCARLPCRGARRLARGAAGRHGCVAAAGAAAP